MARNVSRAVEARGRTFAQRQYGLGVSHSGQRLQRLATASNSRATLAAHRSSSCLTADLAHACTSSCVSMAGHSAARR